MSDFDCGDSSSYDQSDVTDSSANEQAEVSPDAEQVESQVIAALSEPSDSKSNQDQVVQESANEQSEPFSMEALQQHIEPEASTIKDTQQSAENSEVPNEPAESEQLQEKAPEQRETKEIKQIAAVQEIPQPAAVEPQETGQLESVKFVPIPETLEKQYLELFPTFPNGLVRSEVDGFVCQPYMANNFEKVRNIKLRNDDIWIRTFPRSGTTWVSEMVWLIVNDFNFDLAAQIPLSIRSPNIDGNYMNDWSDYAPPDILKHVMTTEKIADMPTSSPRVLKSHMPDYMLPPNLVDTCKVVYVARNPKDAIVSFYHFHKLVKMSQYNGEFDHFVDLFLKDLLSWTPYFNNVLKAWAIRDKPNMHFIFYEDLKRDLRGSLIKLAEFIGKPLTDEQLYKLVEHGKIDKFAKNDAVNYSAEIKAGMGNEGQKFIRKGKTGDWKNYFSPELSQLVDEWMEKHLAGTGLRFVTELEEQD